MAGRSPIANPEFARAVAQSYVNGDSREEMAEIFGVHKDTISTWTRDPRVQAHTIKFATERVMRITRRIDSEIERRVEDLEEADIDTMLKIRKEYTERALKNLAQPGDNEQAKNVSDTIEALESDPEMARELQRLFGSGGSDS